MDGRALAGVVPGLDASEVLMAPLPAGCHCSASGRSLMAFRGRAAEVGLLVVKVMAEKTACPDLKRAGRFPSSREAMMVSSVPTVTVAGPLVAAAAINTPSTKQEAASEDATMLHSSSGVDRSSSSRSSFFWRAYPRRLPS